MISFLSSINTSVADESSCTTEKYVRVDAEEVDKAVIKMGQEEAFETPERASETGFG